MPDAARRLWARLSLLRAIRVLLPLPWAHPRGAILGSCTASSDLRRCTVPLRLLLLTQVSYHSAHRLDTRSSLVKRAPWCVLLLCFRTGEGFPALWERHALPTRHGTLGSKAGYYIRTTRTTTW